jgi:hypothetical protein
LKTPILLWGNGLCTAVGNIMAPFLLDIASHGFTILADGAIEKDNKGLNYNSLLSRPRSTSAYMKAALDWAEKQSGTGEWAHLDVKRIAAGGQSCGGMEAAYMSTDPRVKTIGFFNSGRFPGPRLPPAILNAPGAKGSQSSLGGILDMFKAPEASSYRLPVFYFLGGPTDIATNAVSSYRSWLCIANGLVVNGRLHQNSCRYPCLARQLASSWARRNV